MKKSERTRQAILDSALQAFMAQSYDQVGVREIAARAEVSPAMINRYFGSKQMLFREVLRDATDYSELYDCPIDQLGRQLARFLVEGRLRKKSGELLALNTDRLLLLVRSVGCPDAVPLLRESLAEKMGGPLMRALPGPNVQEKAALLLSHFLGFLIVHSLIGAACAVEAESRVMEDQLGLSFQAIIDS